ncbi:MAG: ABC transporter permease DevC [Thermoguttaceae bacterium]|jgi:putative ABC transport system permease protein
MPRLRPTPLARSNLTHNLRRLAVAVAGIGFAVVLMFMQLGFRSALFDSTVKVVADLDADLLLVNKAQYALPARQSFDYKRIAQARGCGGVAAVYPLYTETMGTDWQPAPDPTKRVADAKPYPIRVLAFNLDDPVFLTPEIRAQTEALREPGTALIDSRSKKQYGIPKTIEMVRRMQGEELASQSIRLVGTFPMGTDFANDGNLIMSTANLVKFFPYRAMGSDPLGSVDLGIVRVAPGADLQEVRRGLQSRFQDTELAVYTKQDFIRKEIGFWDRSTPIGYIFGIGTIMGFIVGVIICYQVIYSDIADHMPEFATLKAMGYRNRFFMGIVLQMALYLSVIGYVPGLLISMLVYDRLAHGTGLLLNMTLPEAGLVFVLTLGMCIASGCLAMRKVLAADPAELF